LSSADGVASALLRRLPAPASVGLSHQKRRWLLRRRRLRVFVAVDVVAGSRRVKQGVPPRREAAAVRGRSGLAGSGLRAVAAARRAGVAGVFGGGAVGGRRRQA
jgi:hypothetical protein